MKADACEPFDLEVRLSRRARRRRIVVTPERVTVVGPAGDSPVALRRLARRRSDWILRRQADLRRRSRALSRLTDWQPVDGAEVPYRGRRLTLRIGPADRGGRTSVSAEGELLVCSCPCGEEAVQAAVDGWMADRLRAEGGRLAEAYAERLGVRAPPVRVRRMKTRWGSLGSTGRLTLNLLLAHLPAWAWEQVVAHEVCHLVVPGHSRKFWSLLWNVLPPEVPRVKRLERALGME